MASYPLLELAGSAEELEIATALVHEHGCLGTEERDDASKLHAYFPDSANVHAIVDELLGHDFGASTHPRCGLSAALTLGLLVHDALDESVVIG